MEFKPKKNPKVDQKSAGSSLYCPVEKIHKLLKTKAKSLSLESNLVAAVYLSGVLNYLVTELIEISGNQCKLSVNESHTIIDNHHIMTAINNDNTIKSLFSTMESNCDLVYKDTPTTPPHPIELTDTTTQSEKLKPTQKKILSSESTTTPKSEPKKALSAYNYFLKEAWKAERDSPLSTEEKRNKINQRWKNMSTDEKEPFNNQSIEDKIRYQKELGQYNISPLQINKSKYHLDNTPKSPVSNPLSSETTTQSSPQNSNECTDTLPEITILPDEDNRNLCNPNHEKRSAD